MSDVPMPPPSGQPSVPPAAEPMPTDPAAVDDAAPKVLLAESGGAEVAEALAREWRGDDFRANVVFATRTLAAFAGTEFGAKLAAAGLLRDPALWRQAARLGRALASETGRDDGPARRGAVRRILTRP